MSGPDIGMVLAAGLGTRMRPLTNDRPKALVEVGGRTLLDHVLDRFAGGGVRQAVVNVHHFADRAEAHLAARTGPPPVVMSDERAQLLETGGAVVKALPLLGPAPFFTANVDSIALDDPGLPGPLETLRAAWDDTRMDALLLLADVTRALGYAGKGDFLMDGDGRLARRGEASAAPFAYMGLQILHPRAMAGLAAEPFSLNRVWDTILSQGRLYGVRLNGFWMHVGDPEAREAAEARLRAQVPSGVSSGV